MADTIYRISLFRDGHHIDNKYFSTLDKAIEYMDTLILTGWKRQLNEGHVKVDRYAGVVDIHWIYEDVYWIESIELDPPQYPLTNRMGYVEF